MKKLKRIVPLIATILIIAVGLYTPRFVSTAYDYHLSAQIKEMENSSVSLEFSKKADYFERAYYFSHASNTGYVTDLDLNGNYNLTSDEVEKNVKDVIKLFGLEDLSTHSPKVLPMLFVYSDNMQEYNISIADESSSAAVGAADENSNTVKSYVFWQCIWPSDELGDQVIFVDDETGLIVGFSLESAMFISDGAVDFEGADSILSYYKEECSADSMDVEYVDSKGYWNILVEKDNKKYSYPVFFDGIRISFNVM